MDGGNHEHWLDRLAEQQPTRRQLLKAAIAGAALILPLGRGLNALAATTHADCNVALGPGPNDCFRGCNSTAVAAYASANGKCHTAASISPGEVVGVLLAGTYGVAGIVLGGTSVARHGLAVVQACADTAWLDYKKTVDDSCAKPFCPGWSPCELDYCKSCERVGGVCCPDPGTKTGYYCCPAPPAGCCTDKCHTSTTECGGK
jgi:hypothetical protein